MKPKYILILSLFNFLLLFTSSCKEDIDESNLYTFTGETIEDYLANRPEQFSDFNYILTRIGYDKILSAYGTYTCFAPTNEAVAEYLDSLYDDPVNIENPHNGMTQRGLEGLTDSLCKDIALFHLLATEVMGVNMGNGMTIKTMLGRDINTNIDPESGAVLISRASAITSMDNELENGVLHEIDCVIRRSNMLIVGEMENHPDQFTLFSQALKLTGLADSLTDISRTDFEPVINTKPPFYVPEKCELGYTIFAETDDVLKEHGITDINTLKAYADSVYAHSGDADGGWYDYARSNNIQISTGDDYKNPWNTLSMFVRYHILNFKLPYDKLVNPHNQISKVTLVEYYETMLPYTLLKITRNSNKLMVNRWIANNSLTDMVAELGSSSMHTVLFDGVELVGISGQVASYNGYIHPLKNMLAYDVKVPHGALNERLRFDDTSFLGEMMSNSFRRISDSEVNALNGGKTGTDGDLSGSYIRMPPGFLKNIVIYNGDDTRLYYLPGQSSGWSNYQGDEFNCKGHYDFAMRLPPVPEGTYELRIGYTAEGNEQRGMLQFYMGSSSELKTMKALDIPLDMRHVSADNANLDPDIITGWCNWTKLDDKGIESDANMRNLGYMRGPLYYTVGINSGNYARNNPKDLRRIIARQEFKQGEYWLRFKSVVDADHHQFHLDYIEFCPENVYNNTRYAEDMY
ncbi:MAG: fasciclin domain-containing protein [Prevotella sp.]|nr:fasciclin domain-containing protein [Prevotella sp.]